MDDPTPADQPTRAQCVQAAGLAFAEGRRLRDTLPVVEAARRAYTPTGPTLGELERRIRARRATDAAAVAA